ncbi:hypothetical protein HYC85_025782 [Camellia sinensis]|uniref:Anaphase-promoting complex subunit 4 WD40 domain-containing protein n=1 Tax=Camellia sinensis TaxID=4442 RepID=A0A7J7GG02_CAMSI|nr:hypothetical protein HYC85_025782 [Camellia sinensis]
MKVKIIRPLWLILPLTELFFSGSRVDYDAPGHSCTTMLYSADGSSLFSSFLILSFRLFSCGTGKDGDSFLVEWNESEGAIKRTYSGFRKKSVGVVQFDTTQNHFLAVGEDHQIKFWNMDNNDILTSMDAEGGLPSLPRLRFNKERNLLAVTTADNGIKILATTAGLRSLRVVEAPSFEALRSPIESAAIKSIFVEENSELGEGLKATANVVPQQWQPNSGLVMTNDVTGVNLEEAVPCIALSKNDSYVMSACGGKVSVLDCVCNFVASVCMSHSLSLLEGTIVDKVIAELETCGFQSLIAGIGGNGLQISFHSSS